MRNVIEADRRTHSVKSTARKVHVTWFQNVVSYSRIQGSKRHRTILPGAPAKILDVAFVGINFTMHRYIFHIPCSQNLKESK